MEALKILLAPEHGEQIVRWFRTFEDVEDRAKVITLDEIKDEGWTLNISRYVLPPIGEDIPPLSGGRRHVQASTYGSARRRRPPPHGADRGRVAGMSDHLSQEGTRVLPLGRSYAAARAHRCQRLQAVHLPAALLQAALGCLGRGLPRSLRRLSGRGLRHGDRQRPLHHPRRCALERTPAMPHAMSAGLC